MKENKSKKRIDGHLVREYMALRTNMALRSATELKLQLTHTQVLELQNRYVEELETMEQERAKISIQCLATLSGNSQTQHRGISPV